VGAVVTWNRNHQRAPVVLLSHDEAHPFDVQGRDGRSPFFIICDRAGRLLPRSLGTLRSYAGTWVA
jgi:predicted N-formylglutamate amidohydrolase